MSDDTVDCLAKCCAQEQEELSCTNILHLVKMREGVQLSIAIAIKTHAFINNTDLGEANLHRGGPGGRNRKGLYISALFLSP